MISSVRSRLVAAAAAFLLGFAVANVAVFVVTGADRWLLIGIAAVLMVTGAVGVLVADTPRRLSLWAVLGLEVLAVFTALPLLWTFTVATSSQVPSGLWPDGVSWSAFDTVLSDATYRRATATSVLVGLVAALIAMLVAVPAGFVLVRRPFRGGRVFYGLVVAALLTPLVAFAGPWADQVLSLGWFDHRWSLLLPMLGVTVPLATWFVVTVARTAPWHLLDSVRADGATTGQQLRTFAVPALGPGLLLSTVLVVVVACHDVVLGAALSASEGARPLPATLLLAADRDDHAVVAAAGLLWLLPVLVIALVMPRRALTLLGRTYR